MTLLRMVTIVQKGRHRTLIDASAVRFDAVRAVTQEPAGWPQRQDNLAAAEEVEGDAPC